jgi:hypothetical protein
MLFDFQQDIVSWALKRGLSEPSLKKVTGGRQSRISKKPTPTPQSKCHLLHKEGHMASDNQRKHHYRMIKRVLSGAIDPAGPGEMADLMRHEGFSCSEQKAAIIKGLWAEEDRIIHRNMARVYKWHDDLPPCHRCHAKLFAFCMSTCRECKEFQVWAGDGKRKQRLDKTA